MPKWVGAEDVFQKIEEARGLVLAATHLKDEDCDWLNRHFDLAFEGRFDYLRTLTHVLEN